MLVLTRAWSGRGDPRGAGLACVPSMWHSLAVHGLFPAGWRRRDRAARGLRARPPRGGVPPPGTRWPGPTKACIPHRGRGVTRAARRGRRCHVPRASGPGSGTGGHPAGHGRRPSRGRLPPGRRQPRASALDETAGAGPHGPRTGGQGGGRRRGVSGAPRRRNTRCAGPGRQTVGGPPRRRPPTGLQPPGPSPGRTARCVTNASGTRGVRASRCRASGHA